MRNVHYPRDAAAILFAGVFAVLSISTANAGGKGGHVGEVSFRGPLATDAASADKEPEERSLRCDLSRTCVILIGARGGHVGEVRSPGASARTGL